jgi:hypothetical protein
MQATSLGMGRHATVRHPSTVLADALEPDAVETTDGLDHLLHPALAWTVGGGHGEMFAR